MPTQIIGSPVEPEAAYPVAGQLHGQAARRIQMATGALSILYAYRQQGWLPYDTEPYDDASAASDIRAVLGKLRDELTAMLEAEEVAS